jgi:adenine-specific DNA-methyltransferase
MLLSSDKTKTNSSRHKQTRQNATPASIVELADYRHKGEKRKNVPDAGLAIYNNEPAKPVKYSYDPHLDPQLVWTGKAERPSFEVEPVSLHIHERVSTQAILKSVQKGEQNRQLKLFAEPDLPLNKRIEFYQHDMDWTNRLILGDSLLVMNSLKERELMGGKVQMIYMDPPYGIKYASNFQPRIDKPKNVKETDDDLTREPEQIQAYRDTWQLDKHSYLTYLRDRLYLCKELLDETGSIFVQINDENLHLVRCILDEVFLPTNFLGIIAFRKTGGLKSKLLASVVDYLLWYGKNAKITKFHQLFARKKPGDVGATQYRYRFDDVGELATIPSKQLFAVDEREIFTHDNLTSQGNPIIEFQFNGRTYADRYKTNVAGLSRLAQAGRIIAIGNTLRYVRYLHDFPYGPITEFWHDTGISGFEEEKRFVVQTSPEVIERCILMTTDPGDLVLDPTCGSGTTAFCAEKWGRRWITCDTSRVALALARQRVMTAKFEYYKLLDKEKGPAGDFDYETETHIGLENFAQTSEIDSIQSKFQTPIQDALSELNEALGKKLKEWEVQRRPGVDWPQEAKRSHQRFWTIKKEKKDTIEQSVKPNAREERLLDRPKTEPNIIRVSGPFTVEGIPVPAMEEGSGPLGEITGSSQASVLIELLQKVGVVFPGGRRMTLDNIHPVASAGFVHAEAETFQNENKIRVAVSFGPKYGPVTARQVDEAIRSSYKMGFDVLILAGFAFDPEAQATIHKNLIPKLIVQMAHINPDVIAGPYSDNPLLKTTKTSQLFTVFGEPDIKLEKGKDGFKARLLGVDLYDPTTGEVHSSDADSVPAWFLDDDYDGYTFRICQAFFPNGAMAKSPWDKLENALRGFVDQEKIEAFRGTESLAFKSGDHKQIAVKVVDIRGNEVMIVKSLNGKETA